MAKLRHAGSDRWHRIRDRYEAGGEPVRAIARGEGISRSALYRRARCEGWRHRRRADEPAEPLDAIVARLLGLCARIGQDLSRASIGSRASGEGVDSSDEQERSSDIDGVERQVRLLQSFTRSVQTLAKLSGADGGSGRASQAADDADGEDDIALMRRELERRLDRAVAGG